MPKQKNPDNEQKQERQKLPTGRNASNVSTAQELRISMVATPIGNLGDISKRAIEALNACDEIWCEDTRHTQALLNALQIESRQRLHRVDQHTPHDEIEQRIKRTKWGQWIVVVSDAGTPGISDPGAKVIEVARKGCESALETMPAIKIEPIPGASAVTALLSISGVHENAFSFLGFFPREEKEANIILKQLENTTFARAFIFFESPNRIQETLSRMIEWVKLPRGHEFEPRFVFAKELTKIHETVLEGRGSDFLQAKMHQHFDSPEKSKGEWCFLIDLSKLSVKNEIPQDDWVLTLDCLITAGVSTKEAAALVSQRYAVAKNLAYKKALEIQKK